MINCIVVDDEPLARQLIVSYIDQLTDLECVGSYDSALAAFAVLHSQSVEVMFLDIEMPGITGMDFVKSLKKHPKVIFITAHAEFAVDAFEIEAVDYLVKPVTFERFLKAVQKVTQPANTPYIAQPVAETSSIFLKVDRRLVKVDFSEICYIEAMGDYLKVHTIHKTYVTYMTLSKVESLIPASKFIRIHRSTIIHTDFVQYVEGNYVMLNHIQLNIGLTYKEGLLKRFS